MKKIEVREYEHFEQLVIVYEASNKEDVGDYDIEPIWEKIDLYDPMLKYDSGINIGYFGEGPSTLARIIVETFGGDYDTSRAYINSRKKVEEYLSKLSNNNNTLKNYVILEKDVKHLL